MATIKVNGMHCENCKTAVENAVKGVNGVKNVKVDLDKKEVSYDLDDPEKMPYALDIVMGAIHDLGYEAEEKKA